METKTELSITSRVLEQNGIALLTLEGYIDSTTALLLKHEIEHLGKKIFRFIIDFSGVEYVSSAGWGVFLTCIREFRGKEGDIIFVNMSDEVQSVFQLIELNQVIKHFPTVDDALKYLGVSTPVSLADFVDLTSDEHRSHKPQQLTVADANCSCPCANLEHTEANNCITPGDAQLIFEHYLGLAVLPSCCADFTCGGASSLNGDGSILSPLEGIRPYLEKRVLYPLPTIARSSETIMIPVMIDNPQGVRRFGLEMQTTSASQVHITNYSHRILTTPTGQR